MNTIAGLLCLREQVAHARRPDADNHLDELGRRHREERHPGLAGHRPRQQCFAGAGWSAEQDPARYAAAQRPIARRVAEEVDHLGQLLLRLVDPGDVGEGDPLARREVVAACPRAGERAERTSAQRRGAAEDPDQQRHE
jgi:hypothetical protein